MSAVANDGKHVSCQLYSHLAILVRSRYSPFSGATESFRVQGHYLKILHSSLGTPRRCTVLLILIVSASCHSRIPSYHLPWTCSAPAAMVLLYFCHRGLCQLGSSIYVSCASLASTWCVVYQGSRKCNSFHRIIQMPGVWLCNIFIQFSFHPLLSYFPNVFACLSCGPSGALSHCSTPAAYDVGYGETLQLVFDHL